MRAAAVRDWARARTIPEWAILAAAIAVFGYVGWDSALWDSRLQLLLHLVALGAITGLGVLALRGVRLPRTPLDTPILALLAALALATASAMNHGMSLRAMGSITAFALALPIALLAVRHRPSWVGVITSCRSCSSPSPRCSCSCHAASTGSSPARPACRPFACPARGPRSDRWPCRPS